MRSLRNQFVIYIFVLCTVTHKVLTHKTSRDLTISVASPTLAHLPKILGGPVGILSNPLEFVKSFIPKPGCGFNCGSGERNQQFYNHPHGHQHQNNRPHPPAHSNAFHGNPHRQPHPAYGPPHANNWPSGNFYENNVPQQNYQYGQYGYYQETSFNLPPVSQNVNYGFNTPSFNPTNNLGFIVNHQHTGLSNPMTNQPNIIENIPNQLINSGFEENPKQTLNSESIITNNNHPVSPAIIETPKETSSFINSPINNPNLNQPSPLIPSFNQPLQPATSINSAFNNPNVNPPGLIFEENPKQTINMEAIIPSLNQPLQPTIVETTSENQVIQIIPELNIPAKPIIVETTSDNQVIQIIPEDPTSAQTALVELLKDTEMSLPTTQEAIFNQPPMNISPDAKETQQKVDSLPVHSINPNKETNDFIYPDSARYIQKNNIDINSPDIYPSIDIRRRRSVI